MPILKTPNAEHLDLDGRDVTRLKAPGITERLAAASARKPKRTLAACVGGGRSHRADTHRHFAEGPHEQRLCGERNAVQDGADIV